MHCQSSSSVVRIAVEDAVVAKRGRPRVSDAQTAMRIPTDFIRRADALRTRMLKQDPAALGFGRASRSQVFRIALDLGLRQLEGRYRPSR